MKKSTIYTYIILFLIICIIPTPVYSLLKSAINKNNYENRVEAQAPVFNLSTIEAYPAEYEAYFNDSVPFRSQLIEINSIINYFVFKQSPVSRVERGKSDWLFYNPKGTDGDPMADFTGTNHLTQSELSEYATNLILARDTLLSQGKEFVVMVAPNKATIYGEEYLGKKYQKAEETKADLLVKYLRKNTDLNVVYPKDSLFDAKKELNNHILYYKTDTHWNSLGAYVGTKDLLAAVDITLPDINSLDIVEFTKGPGDLANMAALSKHLKADTDYKLDNYGTNITVNQTFPVENNNKIVGFTAEGLDERSLLLIHDSFSESMIPYLSKQFNNLHTIHTSYYNPEYLAQVDADIVVLEVVERYIPNLLSFKVQ